MSELIIVPNGQSDFHRRLLATVSTLALLVPVCASAEASDQDHPTVWIELGSQLERIDGGQQYFSPPFLSVLHTPNPLEGIAPSVAQRAGRYAIGGEGKISFTPEGSDWVFSAGIRYGRSNSKRNIHQQTVLTVVNRGNPPVAASYTPYAESRSNNSESHAVVDFAVGKDVGLGLFGRSEASAVHLGVRFAQFSTRATATLYGWPDERFILQKPKYVLGSHYHHYYRATSLIDHSFRGVGPSISWDASATLAGEGSGAEFKVDWGLNAAVLFGRQKAQGHHQTKGLYYPGNHHVGTHYTHPVDVDRSRTTTVPNVGGFTGLSLKFPNAKVSLGYRADFFFGAMDGGIDTRKTYDRNFFGPYATISIGLGG